MQIAGKVQYFCRHQSSSRAIILRCFSPPSGYNSFIIFIFGAREHSSSTLLNPSNIIHSIFSHATWCRPFSSDMLLGLMLLYKYHVDKTLSTGIRQCMSNVVDGQNGLTPQQKECRRRHDRKLASLASKRASKSSSGCPST